MGYAIADELASRGADVILISGPTVIAPEHANIKVIHVTTAREMYANAIAYFSQCHAAILAAAVADYRPKSPAEQKIKRTAENMTIELEANPDIAAELGKRKDKQILAGFALETDNHIENAQKKLEIKNFDFIVLNPANEPGAGFMTDTNRITIIDRNKQVEHFELKPKRELAKDIVNKLESFLNLL
jgi:phosphopantothenoylcysteine decarboxylase/phosphopantothenate--cysteine ligase